MKINKKKLGFTLVELLVVIAILAVLATVAIIGYSSFINEAHKSNDNSVVTELNHYLKAANPLDEKVPTATDAAEKLEGCGLNIAELQPSAKEAYYGYNYKTKKFVYVEAPLPDQAVAENLTTFLFVKNDTQIDDAYNAGYSVYLQKGYTYNGTTPFDAKFGLDVGEATVNNIKYESNSSQEVVIRTNGGTLTINAKNDTVDHYGKADKVDVVAIANASYHENGTVQLIAVKEGHVKLESEADVNGIYVYNNSQDQNKDTSFKEIKITVTQGVDVPKLSRSAVEIADTGTKVCTVVTDQAKDVYLFNEGIYEQIKTVDAGKPISDNSAAWADSSANTANTQTAAQQLANEWSGAVAPTWSTTDTTRELADITNKEEALGVESGATAEEIAQAIEEKVEESGKTVEQAQVSSALKGSGTQADPFLVYDYETMQKISDFYDLGYYYFEVDLSKTDNGKIDCTGWVPVKLHGSFDGKGVKFTNVTAVLFQNVGYKLQNENILLKDFDATMNVSSNGDYGAAALIKNIFNAGTTTFTNVNVHGYLEGFWNMGSYYNYGTANYDDVGCDYEVVFNNCNSDATLVCASGNTIGGLFGHAYEGDGHSFTLRVNNTEYTGQMFLTTSNGKGNKYFGMTSDYYNAYNHFYFDGVEDTFDNGNSKNAGTYANSTKITKVNATKGSNGYVIEKQANVSKIVVTITAQLTAYDSNNEQIANLSGITMTLSSKELNELDGTSIKVLDLFNSINITKNESKYDAKIINNSLNISLASSSNYKSGNVRLQVNQYDSTGNIVSAGTIDIATCANATSQWVIK